MKIKGPDPEQNPWMLLLRDLAKYVTKHLPDVPDRKQTNRELEELLMRAYVLGLKKAGLPEEVVSELLDEMETVLVAEQALIVKRKKSNWRNPCASKL